MTTAPLDLLNQWGAWQYGEIGKLGFRTPSYVRKISTGTSITLSDSELLKVDAALARLKKRNEVLFKALLWRFAYRETYQIISHRLGKKSAKFASSLVNSAIWEFGREYENSVIRCD